jgi:hypothetical protein
MDQLHRVEQCGTGLGQLHIKEKRMLACIRRLSAPITLWSPIQFDLIWDKGTIKYTTEPDIGS